MSTPIWLKVGKTHVGLKEVPGAGNNPIIVNWLISLKAWWKEDLTPWCGTFCGILFKSTNHAIPKAWYRAKAWLDWGTKLDRPALGCVVIYSRVGGGHVGIVAGRDTKGRLLVLGGNQSDAVSIAPFGLDRIPDGYRWPADSWEQPNYELPVFVNNEQASLNEA